MLLVVAEVVEVLPPAVVKVNSTLHSAAPGMSGCERNHKDAQPLPLAAAVSGVAIGMASVQERSGLTDGQAEELHCAAGMRGSSSRLSGVKPVRYAAYCMEGLRRDAALMFVRRPLVVVKLLPHA